MKVNIIVGDVREELKKLPSDSFACCVTSPPYFGLRCYGNDRQIGLETTLTAYLTEMVDVFREVRRVLKPSGTFWLNIGDCYSGSGRGGNPHAGTKQGTNRGSQTVGVLYGRTQEDQATERERIKTINKSLVQSGLKPKDLMMVPARLALALQEDGWWIRSEIIWQKPNPMPESVLDRPTCAHEKVFLLTKNKSYFYDCNAIKEKTVSNKKRGLALHDDLVSTNGNSGLDRKPVEEFRNARNIWTITPKPFKGAHFAVMPPELAERCIRAGCPVDGSVLDPFGGSGTTGLVAQRLGRSATMIELNPEYAAMAQERLEQDKPKQHND